jgi:group I intron endonuclease
MPYIYKITNNINNKAYIGKTIRSIEERWSEHKQESQRSKNRPLYRAINKYGVENFSIEQIEECIIDELSDREIYWINVFNTYHNGYNATYGGDGAQYADYDMIYALYNQQKTCKEIQEITKYDHTTIANALNSKGIYFEERKRRAVERISKPVARLDKNTGEILEVFHSTKEADRIYKTNRHIPDVCNGKRKTAGGYGWKYI